MLHSEVDHRLVPRSAQSRLEGTRLVVGPGVDDTRVMAGLMPGPDIVFFEHGHPQPGAGKPLRDGKADDATANNGD